MAAAASTSLQARETFPVLDTMFQQSGCLANLAKITEVGQEIVIQFGLHSKKLDTHPEKSAALSFDGHATNTHIVDAATTHFIRTEQGFRVTSTVGTYSNQNLWGKSAHSFNSLPVEAGDSAVAQSGGTQQALTIVRHPLAKGMGQALTNQKDSIIQGNAQQAAKIFLIVQNACQNGVPLPQLFQTNETHVFFGLRVYDRRIDAENLNLSTYCVQALTIDEFDGELPIISARTRNVFTKTSLQMWAKQLEENPEFDRSQKIEEMQKNYYKVDQHIGVQDGYGHWVGMARGLTAPNLGKGAVHLGFGQVQTAVASFAEKEQQINLPAYVKPSAASKPPLAIELLPDSSAAP